MVGARRSPANGGKRPSESTTHLVCGSPSKMLKCTDAVETGTSSGTSEIGMGSMEMGGSSGRSKMGSDTRMAPPHLPTTFGIRFDFSQNPDLQITASHTKDEVKSCDEKRESKSFLDGRPHQFKNLGQTVQNGLEAPQSGANMQPPFVNANFSMESVTDESARPAVSECIDPRMTQQTDHPANVHVLEPVDAYKDTPEKVTSQRPSSHRRRQGGKHKGASDGYDGEVDGVGAGIGRNVERAASSRPLYMDSYDESMQRPQAGEDESFDFGNLLPQSIHGHHLLKSRSNNVQVGDLDEEERMRDRLLIPSSKKGLHMNETETTPGPGRTANCDGAQTQFQQNSSLHPPGRAVLPQPESWLLLPTLAVWQIWRSLCTDSDRIMMRLVSSAWYNELPKLMATRPWVIGTKMGEGIFHSIHRNRLMELKFRIKVPDGCFCGSCHDFIISEVNSGCSLWNPCDGMILPLPLKRYNKIVMQATCDELAFAHAPGKVTLSYGRPASESTWKPAVCLDRTIRDICQSGKDFYAVNGSFHLYRLNQENGQMVMLSAQQRSAEIIELLPNGKSPDHIMIADLNNELLVIALGRSLQYAQVFKVAWLDERTIRLVMIDDLGGFSLFIGRNQSIALNSRDFPGIEGNSLYIALEPVLDDVCQTVQVYSLQAKTVAYAEYPSDKLGVPFFYQPLCVSYL